MPHACRKSVNRWTSAVLCLIACVQGEAVAAQSGESSRRFDVREFGAKGDRVSLDSAAINKAIASCAEAGGGQVYFPAGSYLSGTIHLRSHVSVYLDAGAGLIGTTNLHEYQAPHVPAFMPEARWGKWHRALLVGENIEDVSISGPGTIDGNKVFDPTGEEKMRGPHTIAFVNCRQFVIRDISIRDSANYAILFQASDDVEVRNVTITGGWDGVHFRGAPGHWCHNVKIMDCRFYTGDDSIAGRYWDNTLISGCIVNSSCNGIRLIGPATHLTVNHCLFFGPGEQPHRTSARTNMLSGIMLQPGGWDRTEGLLDDVLLADNTMKWVASAVTIWTRGNNSVGRVSVIGLHAIGVYRSAISVESWAEAPITNVVFRDVSVEFEGGGTAEQGTQSVKGPGVDARKLPSWGFYGRNVEKVVLDNVRLSFAKEDKRPAIMTESVATLEMSNVNYPQVEAIDEVVRRKSQTPNPNPQ